MSNITKNQQRLEDIIAALETGRGSIGSLAAMIAAKAIINIALAEHAECQDSPDTIEMNRRVNNDLDECQIREEAKTVRPPPITTGPWDKK